MATPHQIIPVKVGTVPLEQVIALHSRDKATLGFFPRGAFEDYARKEGIFAALDTKGDVLGYIAVRFSDGWTHIAHLCVGENHRRSSIARDLVDLAASNAIKHQHLGLRLKCRRDFKASKFWPKVNFVARAQKLGRGAEPSELTVWVRRNSEVPDLFTQGDSDDPERRIVVLDANTFFDLSQEGNYSDELAEHTKESLQLSADWIQDAIELCVVNEIFAEIERRGCPIERSSQRNRACAFRELSYDESKKGTFYILLTAILKWHKPKDQQRSDMMQIAKAAAANAEYFVTRDEYLLRAAPEIMAELSISVLRPSALLTRIDEEDRRSVYSPARLAGTNISVQNPNDVVAKNALEAFLGRKPQEPMHKFRSLTQRILAQSAGRPNQLLKILSDDQSAPVALIAFHPTKDDHLKIELLRAAAHRLGPTAIRHFLFTAIQRAADLNIRKIILVDEHLSEPVRKSLADLHFRQKNKQWHRDLCPEILATESLAPVLELSPPREGWTNDQLIDIEDRFWPLKIRGNDIPCVVVTINDHWAAKLFDSELASRELFAVDPHRVLNRENVFYRNKTNWPKAHPKRILWYVSRTNTFRASSRLLSVQRAPAFKLFRQYERLGVYTWNDLIKTTNGDPHGELMAIHFTDTELFDLPVPRPIAENFGVGRMVAGPQPISEEQFFQIYSLGLSRFSK